MALWSIIAALTGLCLLVLLRTFRADRRLPPDESGREVAFYRAQVEELERQHALGQIAGPDLDAARAEAARRLLAAQDEAGLPFASDRGRARIAAVALLVGMPAVALPLYLALGSPYEPAQPLAERLVDVPPEQQEAAALLTRMEQMIAKGPDDPRAYALIAPLYMRTGRYDDAARAWRRVIDAGPDSATLEANYAEALVYRGDGVVSIDARAAFERALSLDPKFAKARYYLSVAAEQGGDREKALSMLKSLRDDTTEMGLRSRLEREISRLTVALTTGQAN